MKLIDLTLDLDKADNSYEITSENVELKSLNTKYTGVIHNFAFSSMAGTYIDFPGHIKETDNGEDAVSYPLEKLYRRKATVIRLDREDGSGEVTSDELRAAAPISEMDTPVLVLNALGDKRFDDIKLRSVYLTLDAVEWICSSGVEIIISDIYESVPLEGVFLEFFKHNVSTVCFPINLSELTTPSCDITILPLKAPQAVQLPCRVMAEIQ
jgi:kynurenine formamidase